MRWTRAQFAVAQELDELLSKSTPYALSSPKFGSPTIHDFVKGLILSTNIIELIDNHIPNNYRADWGQVIDEKDGDTLSRECDIIIYEGKPFKNIKNKCIRFVLVDKKRVKVVIQIRSSIQSVRSEDVEYCKQLKKLVPQVWFIAECCWARSKSRVDTINRELKKAEYDHFFYFYRKNDISLEQNTEYNSFFEFIDLVRKIK